MKQTLKHLLPAGALGLVVLGGLSGQAAASPILGDVNFSIGVEAGPPPPPHEVMVASPGPDYVWVGGFWDGAPGHYRWVGGHWDRPPHGRSRWVSPRWDRDHDGHYHRVEGGWR